MRSLRTYISRMPLPFVVLTAVTAGIVAGRKMLGKEVLAQKNKAIEAAAKETRERIRSHAAELVIASFRKFAVVTAIKLVILLALWGAFHADLISADVFSWSVAGALFLFLARDVKVNFPIWQLCFTELHRHGWKPRLALSETVAARVFSEVLAEAASTEQSRANKLVLMLAGENRDRMHAEIAEAVANVARQTSWHDLRPFIVSAVIRIGSLMALYSVCVWWMMAH